MDAVLGTMGISQEELDRQRKKMKMVEQFMVMADDIKGLQMLSKGQDAQLDFEFFGILDNMQAQAEAAGDSKSSERLKMLRENLMPLTSFGKIALKQQAAVESLKDVNTPRSFWIGLLRLMRTRPRQSRSRLARRSTTSSSNHSPRASRPARAPSVIV